MLERWTLVACSAVNVYLLGVMVLFATVVYPQFGAVERGPFPALYASFNGRIGVPVVAFEFLSLLLSRRCLERCNDNATHTCGLFDPGSGELFDVPESELDLLATE